MKNSRGLVLALAGAALLRWAGVARTPWLDESLTLRWVHAATWSEWGAAVRSDLVPPAYPLLLTAWASLSDSLVWLRLCSVACGIAMIVCGARWAAASSRRATLPAALLLSSSPFLLRYGVELRAYALVGAATAWVGLASWRVASCNDARGRHTASLLLALLLVCFAHFTAVLLIPAAVVLILVGAADQPVARVPWRGLAGVCGAWALLVVASNPGGVMAGGWWMPPLTPRLAWRSFGEVLGFPGRAAASVPLQAAWLVLVMALGSVVVLAKPARAWTAPLCAAVVYWACLAGVSLVWAPVWWPRTMLPGLVLLLVAVAIATAWLRTPRVAAAAMTVVAALSLFGAVRWLGGEARSHVEPWPAVINSLPDPQHASVVFVIPDYVVAPLIAEGHGDRRRAVALRLDGRGSREAIAAALTGPGKGSPVTLVLRIDLTMRASLETLTPVLADVAARRGAAAVGVVLVMSPDVSLVPELDDTRMQVEAAVTRLFGPPVERREEGALTSLAYASSA